VKLKPRRKEKGERKRSLKGGQEMIGKNILRHYTER
jgi:hypothetical protein